MSTKFNITWITCFAVVLFIGGALRQGELVNQNMNASDQHAYMDYAEKIRTSHFEYIGGRNRMPVYASLMALFYRQDMTDDEFFALGKKVGIGIAVVVLAASVCIFLRFIQPLEALIAALVAAFTVFVYKGPYFQADVLFYGIDFVLFVLMLELIRRPRYPVAIAAGVICGIAHLTKASVLPGLILCLFWLVVLTFRVPREGVTVGEVSAATASTASAAWRRRLHPLLCAAVTAGVFLLVVFPYIHTSKIRFGQYFYNVNSTFYIWCDSWDEATSIRDYGDRSGWPDLPPEQIPSLHKYLHEHSVSQMITRVADGAETIRDTAAKSYGYAPFVLLYFCFAGLLLYQNRTHFISLVRNNATGILLLFVLSWFGSYLLLYAWYTPIASGNRFFLALFLPTIFCLVWVIDYASKHDLGFGILGRRIPATVVSPIVLFGLLFYILMVFPEQISHMPGGH